MSGNGYIGNSPPGVPLTAGDLTGALSTKGDLLVRTASTAARKAVGSDGQAVHADSSQTDGLVYLDNPSRPNLLVNPNWQIDQINEGALYTSISPANVQGPDGWSLAANGGGVFKTRTLADSDSAALKCLEITCTTAAAAPAAGDYYFLFTNVEGYDAAGLMAGTASALAITAQFKFKTNVTGVYPVAIRNSAVNRSYVGSITVADTAEHEYHVTLTMDTSGTWLYTNGTGLTLSIGLAIGSTFQTTTGTWQAGNFFGTSGAANFMSANTNVAYLKRIQLIPGALVQAYRPADIQKELAKAQRYYWKSFTQGTAVAQSVGAGTSELRWQLIGGASSSTRYYQVLPVVMRAAPAVTLYNPAAANAQARDEIAAADCSSTAAGVLCDRGFEVTATANGGSSSLNLIGVHASANARLS